jgi:hypothetical protein
VTAFTPGPWTVEYPMGDEEHIIVPAGKETYDWVFIASVTPTDDDDPGRPRISKAQALANATLIAAAPDLLSALNDLVYYEKCRDPNRGSLFATAMTMAERALAKATTP